VGADGEWGSEIALPPLHTSDTHQQLLQGKLLQQHLRHKKAEGIFIPNAGYLIA